MTTKIGGLLTTLPKFISGSPLLKNAGITFGLRISGAALLFVFNWVIVKLLGVSGSGIFFLAFTILNIFSVIFLFGVDQHILRKISASKKEADTYSFFYKGGVLVLCVSVVGAIIMYSLSGYFGGLFKSPGLVKVNMLLSLSLPFMTLTTMLGSSARAKKKFTQSVFILTNSYYLISITLFFLLYISNNSSLVNVTKTFLVAMVLSFFINLYLTLRIYNPHKLLRYRKYYKNLTFLGLTKDSYQLFLVSVIYLGFGSVNILLVGFFLQESDVSVFSVAEKIAKLLTFSLFAINMVLAPSISKYFSDGNHVKLNREIQKSTILSIVFATPLLLLLIFIPEFFMGIFGPEYREGANILRLLTIGQAVNAFTGAVYITMLMTNLESKMSIISLGTLLVEFILGVLLIPKFGIVGAAWTAAIGWSMVNILGVSYLYKYRSINIFPSRVLVKELLSNAKNSLS